MKKEFLTYDSVNLASEEVFIEWIKDNKNHTQWKAFILKHPDFITVVEEAKRLIENLEFSKYDLSNNQKHTLWNKIENEISSDKINQHPGRKNKIILLTTMVASAAAVFLLIWSIVGTGTHTFIKSDTGSDLLVSLPDQSHIKLNAQSSVQYRKDSYEETREIRMEGEAFFQVEKGNSFIVEMNLGQVEVLGTSFNIYSRDDSLAVQCYTGKVRVTIEDEVKILTPGKAITYSSKSKKLLSPTFALEAQEPSWTKGRFAYNQTSLAIILAEIERQFGIEFIIKDESIKSKIIKNGGFRNDDLQNALEEVLWPLNLQFNANNAQVEIYR